MHGWHKITITFFLRGNEFQSMSNPFTPISIPHLRSEAFVSSQSNTVTSVSATRSYIIFIWRDVVVVATRLTTMWSKGGGEASAGSGSRIAQCYFTLQPPMYE